jgi:hypothetical protein
VRKAWRFLKAKRFTAGVVALVIVLLVGVALLQGSMDSGASARSSVEGSSPYETGRSILDLLGGVRETLAAYFWTKTDTIFHNYYGHDVTKEVPLYPYYWMISRLDPHFVMANYFASYMLCELGRPQAGLQLALEGVRNNPDSALLQENLASIYFYFMKDPAKAAYHSSRAIALAKSKDEAGIYRIFQNLVEAVLSGQKKMPRTIPLKEVMRTNPDED